MISPITYLCDRWLKPLMRWKLLAGLAAALMLMPAGCGMIDEDNIDCPENVTLTYTLNLVNNKDEEMDAKLGTVHDRPLREALEDYLTNVFVESIHDVDLSFYDQRQHGLRTSHMTDIMDTDQKVYEVKLKPSDYRHVGVGNLSRVPMLTLYDDDTYEGLRIVQDAGSVANHPTGIYTSRKSFVIHERESKQIEAQLFMANCAAALVLNIDSCDVKSIRADYIGIADSFRVADSAYTFAPGTLIHTDVIDAHPYVHEEAGPVETEADSWIYAPFWEFWETLPMMVCGVMLPTPNVSSAVIGTTPMIWSINLYVTLADDTVTRNEIYIGEPVPAGTLKIIRGWLFHDGGFSPHPPYSQVPPGWFPQPDVDSLVVGVSVMLDWKEGPSFNPDL